MTVTLDQAPPAGAPASTTGEWLVAHRHATDRGEADWLSALARFDLAAGWAGDGQLSCVEWLVWRTKMARGTAHDKVRVARALMWRPELADALAAGDISYCAVRAITRIDHPSPEVDQALIEVAKAGSVNDIERAVRHWQLCADQERPPTDLDERRGVRVVRGYDGTGRIEITLADLELEEVAATLDAFIDLTYRRADETAPASSREDSTATPSRGGQRPSGARRADAFVDLVRTALAHADDGHAAGDDRYLVHLVKTPGITNLETLDGMPLDQSSSATVACDTSTASGDGRRTRTWSTAQRRAVMVRDGGRCRFPGCERRHVDVHHHIPWSHGGATTVTNAMAACPRHHSLLHAGYYATGTPEDTLVFHRPNHSVLGSTTARRPRSPT